MLARLKKFIQEDIWDNNFRKDSPVISFFIRQLRMIIFAIKGFIEERVSLRASALTYYTLLSVVPIAAMAFGMAKGFGFQNKMEEFIITNFKGQEEVMNWIIDLSFSVLENVQGGLLAGIGLVILIWSVMQVLTNIENSFNAIWRVKKPRTLIRKLSDYLSIMLIAPLLIIISSSVMLYISTRVQDVTGRMEILQSISPFFDTLLQFVPYALIWLLFTLIYIIMPNTKVKFKYALIAGIFAGTLFQLTQWGYIHFQIGVSKYSALYGTFAALPLFLIWLQISWLIVLLGAEITFAYQNITQYQYETEAIDVSYHNRRIISLLILNLIIKSFEKGENPPLTSAYISKELSIPLRLVREILNDLIMAGVINETLTDIPSENGYQPALDIGKISIQYVNEKLESIGSDRVIVKESAAFEKINEIYDDMYKLLYSSPANKLLKDI